MKKNLIEMFNDVVNTQKEILDVTRETVDDIIESRIRNVYEIEHTLDTLLDLTEYFKEAVLLFIKLCDYYKTIDYESACDYLEYLNNCFDSEDDFDNHMKRIRGIRNEV